MAVSWRPRAFGPLLDLARAYLMARETWRAHRALAQAREVDPGRFAREVPRCLERDGVDPRTFTYLLGLSDPDRGDERRVRAKARARAAGGRVVSPSSLPYGDCLNLDEYARFQAMPPISSSERESIDWDQLLSDLLDD